MRARRATTALLALALTATACGGGREATSDGIASEAASIQGRATETGRS